jgi:hypothetical protein
VFINPKMADTINNDLSWTGSTDWVCVSYGLEPPLDVDVSNIHVDVSSVSADESNPTAAAVTASGAPTTAIAVFTDEQLTSATESNDPTDYLYLQGNNWNSVGSVWTSHTYDADGSVAAASWLGLTGKAFHITLSLDTSLNLLTPLKVVGLGGTVLIRQWNRTSGAWVDADQLSGTNYGYQYVDDPITASIADWDTGIGLSAAQNQSITLQGMTLSDVDADFASMDAVSIRYSSAQLPPNDEYVDDDGNFRVQIFQSDGTTGLVGASSTTAQLMDRFTSGSWAFGLLKAMVTEPDYNKVNQFPWLDTTATKADWQDAVVEITFTDTRSMGSDAATIILVDFEIIGSYTAAATPSMPAKPLTRKVLYPKMGR